MAIVRMHHRIAVVEAWLKVGGAGGGGSLPPELSDDLARRLRYWHTAGFDPAGSLMIRPADPTVLRVAKGVMWVVLTAAAAAVWAGGAPTIVIGLLALVLIAAAGAWHRPRRRLVDRFARRECSGCAYDLSGSSSPLPALDGVGLGPRQCPECGAAWPMIPPPAPPMPRRVGERRRG
jgi:hypothetical protein